MTSRWRELYPRGTPPMLVDIISSESTLGLALKKASASDAGAMTPDDFDMENAPSPQPVAQRIPEQPQRGERTAEPFSAGDGLRRQVRETVAAFGGSRHSFGVTLARARPHPRALAPKPLSHKND